MEFGADFELPLNSDEASSPVVQEKKLKHLKKGVRVSLDPFIDLEVSNERLDSRVESESFGDEGEVSPGVDCVDFGDEGKNGSGTELDSGLDGLDASGVKRALDFDSAGEDFVEEGEKRKGEMLEEIGDMPMEEPEKKRRSFDGGEDEEEKTSKRARNGGHDMKPKDSAVKTKRKVEKERQEHLKELHAETQRLLRETREAAFKPVPIVQKPISSILEKIRRRKMEVSKKSMSMNFLFDESGSSRRIMEEVSSEGAHVDTVGCSGVSKAAIGELIGRQTEKGNDINVVPMHASNDHIDHSGHENGSFQMDVDVVSKHAFRAPIDDTQDLFSDSPTRDSNNENETPRSPLEDVFAPSKLAMDLKLKFDSAPQDDSSDEEDNDKENVDPHSPGLVDLSSSPIRDPVKAFVDDEAEEEDDGDHDQFLFPEKEEDEADEDIEDLQDMIATGYEEQPIDGERRNELHQKWLEQQDASGTEKLMQKLMCGSKLRETISVDEKYAEEEEDQESDDEAADELGNNSESGSPKKVSAQMNLRIAKQMISQMFTDNDVYVSSDDEEDDEPEKRPTKPCSFEKAEEQGTFLSPAEDESCNEVFGRIKKMNIVPDTKKGKRPAVSRMQLKGGDGIISKSSFIRESNQSLPSFRKHGLSTARCSFIFGRDDSNSNSMSTTSMSEDSSDTIQRETTAVRTSAKFSSSQMKSRKEKSQPAAVAKTNDASFFEILRPNSLHSKRCDKETIIDEMIQTISIDRTTDTESVLQMKRTDVVDRTIQSAFASFRLGRAQSRPMKSNLVSMYN